MISKSSAKLILFGKWFGICLMLFTGISILFYFGPSLKCKWKFFTAGSILASLGIILTSIGFNSYINNFFSIQ